MFCLLISLQKSFFNYIINIYVCCKRSGILRSTLFTKIYVKQKVVVIFNSNSSNTLSLIFCIFFICNWTSIYLLFRYIIGAIHKSNKGQFISFVFLLKIIRIFFFFFTKYCAFYFRRVKQKITLNKCLNFFFNLY